MLIHPAKSDDEVMTLYVIYTVFNNAILKFRDNNGLRLLYALFLFNSIKNTEQTLAQLAFLFQNYPSFS